MIVRCTPITALVLSSIVFAPVSARAQVSIDVSKITCDEYVHGKIPTPACRVVGGARHALALANRHLVKWLLSCQTQQWDY
jgi:hypothetical protein